LKTRKTEQTGKSWQGREWIYGLNPVWEAIKSGRNIKSIFISSKRHEKVQEIKKAAEDKNIPVKISDTAFFDITFCKGHQGIAAEVYSRKYVPLDELLGIPYKKNEPPLFFIIDCIEDPRNLGAILRVADAAGVHGIVVQSYRSVTLSSEVSKVSAGAVEYVPVSIVSNIKHAISEMKRMEITIIGAEASAEKKFWEIDLKLPLALVIGSEGRGIRRTVKEKCDILARIPMKGKINSLNVSVATGIFAFEILRQRFRNN
jgi:23S rRNA (guanosine2251-2'-O)-methyltransferase